MDTVQTATARRTYKKREFNFKEKGAFFAFSDSQFEEGKKEGVDYVHVVGGLICPKEHAKTIWKDFGDFAIKESKRELKVRGRIEMIKYHLANYECYYTGDISDALDVLLPLGITKEEVREVYNEERKNNNDY